MISVDIRVAGDSYAVAPGVQCRTQSDGSAYRLGVEPFSQSVVVQRLDAGVTTDLVPWTELRAMQNYNQTNHLDLQCMGSTITALVNGTQVASVQDTTYGSGGWSLEVSLVRGQTAHAGDARFANLVLYLPNAQ